MCAYSGALIIACRRSPRVHLIGLQNGVHLLAPLEIRGRGSPRLSRQIPGVERHGIVAAGVKHRFPVELDLIVHTAHRIAREVAMLHLLIEGHLIIKLLVIVMVVGVHLMPPGENRRAGPILRYVLLLILAQYVGIQRDFPSDLLHVAILPTHFIFYNIFLI